MIDKRTTEQAQATEQNLVKRLSEIIAEKDGQLSACRLELAQLRRENRAANERPDA